MTGFTLDTSGAVPLAYYCAASDQTFVSTMWSDLDPFIQGYVEALFAGPISVGPDAHTYNSVLSLGFSDLAPETLAAILKDCERFTELFGEWPLHDHGKHFWLGRQKDKHPDFPPLTFSLGDDGKVYLKELNQ